MNVADAQGMIDAAKTEGLQEGIKEGIKKGHTGVAKTMLTKGFSVGQIVVATSLSEGEILALQASELVFFSTDNQK